MRCPICKCKLDGAECPSCEKEENYLYSPISLDTTRRYQEPDNSLTCEVEI